MGFTLVNDVTATVASQSNSGTTSLTVGSGQGANFASTSTSNPIRCGVFDSSGNLKFFFDVTARSTDTLTVANRGAEGTTDANILTTDVIAAITTAGMLPQLARSWGDTYGSGKYYAAAPGPVSAQAFGDSELYALGHWFPRQVTLASIGAEVTTGIAGGLARLGIFSPDSNGRPGNLLLDAGTIDCSSTGGKEITISQSVGPGLAFFAYKGTVGGTSKSVRGLTSTSRGAPGYSGDTLTGISQVNASPGYFGGTASGTGAMPSSFTLAGSGPFNQGMPLVVFKVA